MQEEVRLLFHKLANLTHAERERALSEPALDPGVRREVESLLEFDSTRPEHLAACIAGTAEEMLRKAAPRAPAECGPYRLVRLLGAGGMGAVYLAERNDGEIQQTVAVKLLRADSSRAAWHERFLNERQLLASLSHPSIVRLTDAGHTADDRPYLVMEYVEGRPIDEYAAGMPLREQLAIFLQVCEGVSYAHSHLVVHRDLKPSNILVDASGQAKVLDFGIAKLLDESGDATQTVERLVTPNYASPEQLRGSAQTTATDVYSLGAVFYKMLTGRSPHESETHESQALEVMAGTRSVIPPRRLNPRVPADLDSIAGKALRLEREERYASVDLLAADIRAFLESRPVSARSGDAWYRTRKFLRRYRVPVAATALVMASLAAGLYVANRERVIAERRFAQLRQLSNKVFELDQSIMTLPGSTTARAALVSASLEYLEGLAAQSHGDLDLMQELGQAYARVARIQGVPVQLNLGEFQQAEANLKKADGFLEAVLAARPQSRTALYLSARIAQDRMILAESENRRADALVFARKAALRMEAFLGLGAASEAERDGACGVLGNVALSYNNMHSYKEAAHFAARAVEVARTLPFQERGGVRLATGLSLLATAQRYQGDLDAALRSIQEARAVAERAVYPSDTGRMLDMYGVLYREGSILDEEGGVSLDKPEEAVAALQKAFDLTEGAAARDPHDYASRSRLGNCGVPLGNLLRERDPQRALAIYDLVIRRLGEVQKNLTANRDRATALAASSYALRRLHRAAEAKQRIDEAFAILRQTKDYPAGQVPLDRSAVYTTVAALGDFEAGAGDPAGAAATFQDLLDKIMAAKPAPLTDLRDAPRMSRLYETLAVLYRRTGDAEKAGRMEKLRSELWESWDRQLPNNPFVRRQLAPPAARAAVPTA